MYLCLMYSRELLKGTLKPIILKLLSDNGRMYGYEITQRVRELSNDQIQLTEGALYPMLHKMEAEGLLKTEKENAGGRIRKYYRLTATGSRSSESLLTEFSQFIQTMQLILKPNLQDNGIE